MQGQNLDHSTMAMTRYDWERGWTVQQTKIDWEPRKFGGALVSMEYQQTLLWTGLRIAAPTGLRNDR
ncbi:MAG: hypothetical protein BZY88_18470 [SAR202 cluster bacterium Io17-Chloro-G9]|nr:MAG: hypothetical protein BZY88_18470 [SAR202 cluster bacterium Io17-Chloro-G9]